MASGENASELPTPIPYSYWVIPGKLLASEYPRNLDDESSREKLAKFAEAGITVFIDLTEPNEPTAFGEPMKPYCHLLNGACHRRFDIRDMSTPKSKDWTRQALDAIDAHLEAGEAVYVHCWGGVGRTGTIIGCWLARHFEPGQAALNRLAKLWCKNPKSEFRQSPETEQQRCYVREWRG